MTPLYIGDILMGIPSVKPYIAVAVRGAAGLPWDERHPREQTK